MRINQKKLAELLQKKISSKVGVPFSKQNIIDIIFILKDTIIEEVAKGNKVHLLNFGNFCKKDYKSRVLRNPYNSDEKILVPDKFRICFIASNYFKFKINN